MCPGVWGAAAGWHTDAPSARALRGHLKSCPCALSLQPCMHTFCAACYSGWMERSTLCPTCRCPVERICKNHILNNLVEAYLLQHPGKWGACPAPGDGGCLSRGPSASRAMTFALQTRVAVRKMCGAWLPGTRSRRTCCSPKSGGLSPTRRAVRRTCWSCRMWTANPRMLGEPTPGSEWGREPGRQHGVWVLPRAIQLLHRLASLIVGDVS